MNPPPHGTDRHVLGAYGTREMSGKGMVQIWGISASLPQVCVGSWRLPPSDFPPSLVKMTCSSVPKKRWSMLENHWRMLSQPVVVVMRPKVNEISSMSLHVNSEDLPPEPERAAGLSSALISSVADVYSPTGCIMARPTCEFSRPRGSVWLSHLFS